MSSPYDHLDASQKEGVLDVIGDYAPSAIISLVALWIDSSDSETEHLSANQKRKLVNTISGLALNLERIGL